MNNKDIAAAVEEMATLMELKGENAFRIRSYANAARQVELLPEPVTELLEQGTLDSVRGIGREVTFICFTNRVPSDVDGAHATTSVVGADHSSLRVTESG